MKKICYDCGRVIEKGEEYEEYEGEIICRDCIENNYFHCDYCGKLEHVDNGTWLENYGEFLCEGCLTENCEQCEDCNNWYHRDRMYRVYNLDGSSYYVCDGCVDRGNYDYCESCDRYFHCDDGRWRNDYFYCDNCCPDCDILEYHEYHDIEFYKGKNETEPKYYIGKEIELEPICSNYTSEIVNTMNEYINAVAMEDGSLNNGGVEIVTQPESWEYLQEIKESYREFFKKVQYYDYGDAGNAGLHFHISRPNDDIIARIIVIMENFRDEIIKLSRRSIGQIDNWAQFLTNNNKNTMKYKSNKYLKDNFIKSSHSRYYALNLTNTNTIEFRFFNGANNFEEFWGALQFIHNLVEIAYDETIDLNTIKWKDLLVGEELIEQAKKQGVYDIDKTVEDTTELIEKLEKAIEETKKELKKTLNNFVKYVNKELLKYDINQYKGENVEQIREKTDKLFYKIQDNYWFLRNIIGIYNNVDSYDIDSIKSSIKNANDDKYSWYFKRLLNIINKYEREVAA